MRGAADDLALRECATCAAPLHHMCVTENVILKTFADNIKVACFDCSLLEGLVTKKMSPKLVASYYGQIDWAGAKVSPLTLGALIASKSLRLSQHCLTSQRSRLVGPTAKCICCKSEAGDDALLACCFCAKNFCNVEACLGSADAVLPAPLVAKPAFVWACPSCFKRAVDIEVQRGLRPAGQAVPGAKKRKRVPAGARGGRGGRGRGRGRK